MINRLNSLAHSSPVSEALKHRSLSALLLEVVPLTPFSWPADIAPVI